MEAQLDVSGLAFAYDGALAVRNVSLTVNPGEIVALLGANGAGKSTTVRMIAGVRIAFRLARSRRLRVWRSRARPTIMTSSIWRIRASRSPVA